MASKFYNLSTDTTLGGNSPSDYLVPSEKAIKTYVDNNSGGGGGDSANKDLNNLTTLGNARLQYAPFAINAGTVLNGANTTLTYSGSTITCASCTITTCDGRTKTDDNSASYSVSNITNGDYSIFKSYTDGTLSLSSNFEIDFKSATSWTQPVLTANGTVGGSDFAVFASSENGNYKAFQPFSASPADGVGWSPSGAVPQYIGWYNPKRLIVKNIKVQNRLDYAGYMPRAGNVYGSNDNSNYTLITTYTNSNLNAGGEWNIDLSSNNNAYNYYKLEVTSTEGYYLNIYKITLTATQIKSGANGDLWLDTSTTPANLKVYNSANDTWNINNDLVCIGNCTVSSGTVSVLSNNLINDNGYSEGFSTGASWAMPSGTYKELTLGANGASYIAPADGYFVLKRQATAAGNQVTLVSGSLITRTDAYTGSGSIGAFLPVYKGNTVNVHYSGGNHVYLRFVYANGSEREAL